LANKVVLPRKYKH